MEKTEVFGAIKCVEIGDALVIYTGAHRTFEDFQKHTLWIAEKCEKKERTVLVVEDRIAAPTPEMRKFLSAVHRNRPGAIRNTVRSAIVALSSTFLSRSVLGLMCKTFSLFPMRAFENLEDGFIWLEGNGELDFPREEITKWLVKNTDGKIKGADK